MPSDLLGEAIIDSAASIKWRTIPEYQRKLISMSLLASLLKGGEAIRIEHYGREQTPGGREIATLHLAVNVGEFIFAIPTFTDSILILVDFALCDEEVGREEDVPLRTS